MKLTKKVKEEIKEVAFNTWKTDKSENKEVSKITLQAYIDMIFMMNGKELIDKDVVNYLRWLNEEDEEEDGLLTLDEIDKLIVKLKK